MRPREARDEVRIGQPQRFLERLERLGASPSSGPR
jgi:hypothetical protein